MQLLQTAKELDALPEHAVIIEAGWDRTPGDPPCVWKHDGDGYWRSADFVDRHHSVQLVAAKYLRHTYWLLWTPDMEEDAPQQRSTGDDPG